MVGDLWGVYREKYSIRVSFLFQKEKINDFEKKKHIFFMKAIIKLLKIYKKKNSSIFKQIKHKISTTYKDKKLLEQNILLMKKRFFTSRNILYV